ncbi:AAA family ATPase [Salinimicrobium terrae]|uniref:AAA family ATPase n=1 Tax=Salinimicrobium terrae TaxID=470866 RepID=UPI00048EF400|nr:AAA family ATPase [Salinimicrobium terrae]
MIKKIKLIKNLAVFKSFDWDSNLRDKGNTVINFKPINILYGRNYSGKTTLSRILRSLEVGEISNKYENPEFLVSFEDGEDISQSNLTEHQRKIRVFNEDFIKENLKFISNPEDSVLPFAILGGNSSLETEILDLKKELGIDEEEKETGLYLDYKKAKEQLKISQDNFGRESKKLNAQLSDKATDRKVGIKYQPAKFGDQNYSISKLEKDIKSVQKEDFQRIGNNQSKELLILLEEKIKTAIPDPKLHKTKFDIILIQTKELLERKVGDSNKITELVKDSILNRWVKEGKKLHENKLQECAFCGNEISDERWKKLDKHFDEESDKLESEIDQLIRSIDLEKEHLDYYLEIDKNEFYSKFDNKLEQLERIKIDIISRVQNEFDLLKKDLEERKNDILNPKKITAFTTSANRLIWLENLYNKLRTESNSYSSSLKKDQLQAQEDLRLKEVADFLETIKYDEELETINELESIFETDKASKIAILDKIEDLKKLILDKQRLMNDEEKGALKVNEFLNNFFGHEFLTLQAIEHPDENEEKKIKFEIIRDGKKAHHLSEGECSLIAFCYFMAKLDDVETKGTKPIIWIDDPISSLDSNHIFFVYSLINSEIIINDKFEQIFISTHNLDFLKYLKRLPKALNKNLSHYFLITRENNESKICDMPKYLKDYVTEFNFLFHQIYQCAKADSDTSEHSLFYNFANNTRKFLEAFLFYKYPNAVERDDKLKRFFGNNSQAASMTDRINNEYSHLEGLFERSMTPIDVPEMKKTAQFILNKIEEKDEEQYEALLKSIGVEEVQSA